VHNAHFVAICPHAGNLKPRCSISTHESHRATLDLTNGADRRRRFMEIAAFLMCAAVVMGILQQFDRQVW
jgi:hypothetical protein